MATAGTTTKDGRAVVNSDFYSSGNSSKILQNGVLDAGSTDFFYFVNPNNTGFRIDANYVSGAAFSGRFTFADSSFDDLGLTPDKLGIYVANFATGSGGTQSISLTLGGSGPTVTAVPLPAGLPLLLAGLGGMGLLVRRKRLA
jgi:hypothetical protein